MKKNILLTFLCCLTLFHTFANESAGNQPQDSVKVFKKKLNLDLDKVLDGIDIDSSQFMELNDFNININTDSITALAMNAAKEGIKTAKSSLRNLNVDGKGYTAYAFSYDSKGTRQRAEGTPTRIEKKSFSNISEIEFFHKYGNIIVKESNSSQIDLEIQYFDKRDQSASCNIAMSNKLLSITTNNTGRSNSKPQINYIIAVPKNISLNINLDYGDVKLDKLNGSFDANLSYSDLSAQALNKAASVKARYSDVKIGEAQDISISGSYSDFKIEKAKRVESSGNYNDCRFNNVQTLVIPKSSSYGDMKIGTIGSMTGQLMYADIIIDNLLSDIDIRSSYGDVTIKGMSPKVKTINVKGSYCDVAIGLPLNISATFDASLVYGDLNISKKYAVKYTESIEKSNKVTKKGQIGNGTPTATIVVSNNYADIDIR
ncbi:MAG: DUF4097 domain-containing protein [Prevotella sp.]|jgi:hypothetical protein|nr:DUF4097 domain-containing protein [Prevotella sp.]